MSTISDRIAAAFDRVLGFAVPFVERNPRKAATAILVLGAVAAVQAIL